MIVKDTYYVEIFLSDLQGIKVFYYVTADVSFLDWNSAYTHISGINFKMLIKLLRYIVKKVQEPVLKSVFRKF